MTEGEITTTTLSKVSSEWTNASHPLVCNPQITTQLFSNRKTSFVEGTVVTKPDFPLKGNHIDALPYESTVKTISNPHWTAVVKSISGQGQAGRPCGYWRKIQSTFDGRGVDSIGPNEAQLAQLAFTAGEMSICRTLADTKAKANLRAGLINAPLIIADRIQTVNMVKNTIGDMMRTATSMQERDLAQWRKLRSARSKRAFAQAAASKHLEVIFGWLPLFGEIEGAMELLMEPVLDFRKGRGRHTLTKVRSPLVERIGESDGKAEYLGAWYSKREYRSNYSVRTSLRADVTVGITGQIQKMGFNPLYSLYDLTPLSFVSGWFSNFNHWVQSLDPLLGCEFRTGSRSARTISNVVLNTVGVYIPNPSPGGAGSSVVSEGHCTSHSSYRSDVRSVLSSEPDGGFEFYNNFSFYSVTAGISLFLQRKLKILDKAIAAKPFRYRSPRPIYLPPVKWSKP